MIRGIKEVKDGISNIDEVRFNNSLIYKRRKTVDEIVNEGLVTPSKMEILVKDSNYWNEFLNRKDLQNKVKNKATKYNMSSSSPLTSSSGMEGLFILFECWASEGAADPILSADARIRLYGNNQDYEFYCWSQWISEIGDPQYGDNNYWRKSTGDTTTYNNISFLNNYKKPITGIKSASSGGMPTVKDLFGLIIFKIR
jgi:hypothetical protein